MDGTLNKVPEGCYLVDKKCEKNFFNLLFLGLNKRILLWKLIKPSSEKRSQFFRITMNNMKFLSEEV